jgi:hypothetical protein
MPSTLPFAHISPTSSLPHSPQLLANCFLLFSACPLPSTSGYVVYAYLLCFSTEQL